MKASDIINVDMISEALVNAMFDLALFSNLTEDVDDVVVQEALDILFEEVSLALNFNLGNRVKKLKMNSFNRLKGKITYLDTKRYSSESTELANKILLSIPDILSALTEAPHTILADKILEFKVNLKIDPRDIVRVTTLMSVYGDINTNETADVIGNLLGYDTVSLVHDLKSLDGITHDYISEVGECGISYYPYFLVMVVSDLQGMDWFKSPLEFEEVLYLSKLKLKLFKYLNLIKDNDISAKSKNELLRIAIDDVDSDYSFVNYKDTNMYKELRKFYLGGAV